MTTKSTLIAERVDEDSDQTYNRVTHEFYHETFGEFLTSLQQFLRGLGYCFEGDLRIGKPVSNAAADIVKATVDHSKYYYDTDRNR